MSLAALRLEMALPMTRAINSAALTFTDSRGAALAVGARHNGLQLVAVVARVLVACCIGGSPCGVGRDGTGTAALGGGVGGADGRGGRDGLAMTGACKDLLEGKV